MTPKLNWIRGLLTLALGWQLLSLAAPAYADTVYIVQPGDNLYRISLRFGVSQQALMTANHLTNASWVYAGQQLVIPEVGAATTSALPAAFVRPVAFAVEAPTVSGVPTPAAAPTTQIYIVRAGDILQRIASKFGVSQQALMAANSLSNANFIMVGQRLVIPAGDFVPTPAPSTAPDATPVPPSSAPDSVTPAPAEQSSEATFYVVKASDTLWGISRRFGVSVAAIKSVNRLSNDWVTVGQRLIIPGANTTPGPLPETPAPTEMVPPASWPAWIPAITSHFRAFYARSVELGHNPNVFSVAGDCNSDYAVYLGPVASHLESVNLTRYAYLQPTVKRFWNSFTRPSLAVHGGHNTRSVMDPLWANPQQCQSGESPLACELRVSNASIVFISLGTGDQFAWRDFEKNYRAIIDYAIGRTVLPVLVTKADTLESQQGGATPYFIDGVIRRLGQEYDVPVLDLQLAVQDLKNGGLVWEGGQDFHLTGEGSAVHNIITLQTVYAITRGW